MMPAMAPCRLLDFVATIAQSASDAVSVRCLTRSSTRANRSGEPASSRPCTKSVVGLKILMTAAIAIARYSVTVRISCW